MAALGAPIANDRLYPTLLNDISDDYAAPLKLLAKGLAFTDPHTGIKHAFVSGLTL